MPAVPVVRRCIAGIERDRALIPLLGGVPIPCIKVERKRQRGVRFGKVIVQGQSLGRSCLKPWLMTILRNVCRDEYSRHQNSKVTHGDSFLYDDDGVQPLWQEPPTTPETEMLRSLDVQTIHRLITALPEPFREALVLRELNELSYREIAEVVGAPMGTVMSRIARARSMLRKAWSVEGNDRMSGTAARDKRFLPS
jgi:RNA polymerase sigma factor (sigma-70 family)